MLNLEDYPALKPFCFLGFDPSRSSGTQAVGACPFCGKENHFYVDSGNGKFACQRCSASGNGVSWLEQIHESHFTNTTPEDRKRLASIRKIGVNTLKRYKLAWDGFHWWLPVYSDTGRMRNLRKWSEPKGGKKSGPLYNTEGCEAGLWNVKELLDPAKRGWPVWICEGEWDGLKLCELRDKLKLEIVVVAVPGAGTFKTDWVHLFNRREVVLAYDHDEAGIKGLVKVALGHRDPKGRVIKPGMLSGTVRALRFVSWPEGTPDKYDVRDLISEVKGADWGAIWKRLKGLVADRPEHAGEAAGPEDAPKVKATGKNAGNERPRVLTVKGQGAGGRPTFDQICGAYAKWFKLSPDNRASLKLSLAIILSNQIPGDPLWLMMVGPPGFGKTAMLAPLEAHEDCIFQSTITAEMLVSGFPTNPDPSLLAVLTGKTLILKDLTELLDMPDIVRQKVYGVLRGAYDGRVDRQYGNGQVRSYNPHFSMLAGVTNAIHGHSQASLGERFLKYQFRTMSPAEQESIMMKAIMNTGRERELEGELGPILLAFLDRELPNFETLYKRLSRETVGRIVALAQLVALLRTSVERDFRGEEALYRPSPELPTRLVKQLTKFAVLLTEVSGTPTLTEEDFHLIERVAMDTATGWHLDLVYSMMELNQGEPSPIKDIGKKADLPITNVSRRLDDLRRIGVLTKEEREATGERMPRIYYSLNAHVRKLWRTIRAVPAAKKKGLTVKRRKKAGA